MSAIRHTGIVVHDLDKAITFYTGVFGLQLIARRIEQGDYIETLVGIPKLTLEWAKLNDDNGAVLELLCYHSHPDPTPLPEPHYPSNRHGCSHVAFTVDNCEAAEARIRAFGGKCLSAIQRSPDSSVNVAYACDPEGILLEIVEVLK